MYLLLGILLIFCLLFGGWCFFKKRRLRKKIRAMDPCEKICRVNELLAPFGFVYKEAQNVVSTRRDAWQREFGYRGAFDRTAARFNMVFDCLPVYFEYEGRTWLIEFWKGQYGINTGAEIGIYHADKILTGKELRRALFHSASEEEELPISMWLFRSGKPRFELREVHWWLAGFGVGEYCAPKELSLMASVTFRNERMRDRFVEGMLRAGYRFRDLRICGETVSFLFQHSNCGRRGIARKILVCWAQLKNRLFVHLYRWVTKPFEDTPDRILYLYESLPFAFRRMLRFKRNRGQRRRIPKSRKKEKRNARRQKERESGCRKRDCPQDRCQR